MMNSTKDFLRYAQRNRCAICGQPFSKNRPPSRDHVLAISLGGYDGRGNLLLAHTKCNGLKGNRLPTGCEMIWLLTVCDVNRWPVRLTPQMHWKPPHVRRLWRAPLHMIGV